MASKKVHLPAEMDQNQTMTLRDNAQPSLSTCSSQELATWLHQNRFRNEMDLTTFLLEAVSSIPNAQEISDQLCQDDTLEYSDIGSLLPSHTSLTLSFTNPRGKFSVEWYDLGLKLIDSKLCFMTIKEQSIAYVVVFPKPEDMRARHSSKSLTQYALILFTEDEPCHYKNKQQKQVCFQLPSDDDENASLVQALCDRLKVKAESIVRVSSSCFQSHKEAGTSTTTGGMPFVTCYHGVHDGVLFPMPAGLLFYKPPLFLPRSEIHSIACGRGGGMDGGGRYMDVVVETTDGNSVEFSNIHKAEESVINQYVQSLVSDTVSSDNERLEESTSTVEESHDGGTAEESDKKTKRGRVARRAGLAARAACRHQNPDASDDEDADEDFVLKQVSREDHDTDSDGDTGEAASTSTDDENDAGSDDDATESEDDSVRGEELRRLSSVKKARRV